MKVKIFAFLTILVVLCACKKDEPKPPTQPVERTVLVYMAACNNLGDGDYDDMDLAEMRTAAESGGLGKNRLLVYHASPTANTLLEVKPKGNEVLKEYPVEANAVSAKVMRQVITDARALAPSEQFGLVLWSHGYGWLEDGIRETESQASTMSWGSHRGQHMNITTLAEVLEGVQPDFVYFDACYMASVEVAYQLRNATRKIVGSCTELPAAGMPYDRTLPHLMRAGSADLIGAARETFNLYENKPDAVDRTCTMSVINTAGLQRLADVTNRIYRDAPGLWPQGFNPQQFMLASRCYYFDLAQYAEAMTVDVQLKNEFRHALDEVVEYSASTQRLWDAMPLKYHCGLSTYIFRNDAEKLTKNYMDLAWPQYVWTK